jgi:hypothetical protein
VNVDHRADGRLVHAESAARLDVVGLDAGGKRGERRQEREERGERRGERG